MTRGLKSNATLPTTVQDCKIVDVSRESVHQNAIAELETKRMSVKAARVLYEIIF